MLGYDAQAGILKHYRVDKMTEIQPLDAPRQGNEQFQKLDMADYSRKVFSMFGGEEEMVRLRFENRLVGVVMDRFGKDVTVFPKEDGFFEIYTRVVLSPQFYGWIFALGEGVRILSPETAGAGNDGTALPGTESYEVDGDSPKSGKHLKRYWKSPLFFKNWRAFHHMHKKEGPKALLLENADFCLHNQEEFH